MSYILSNDNRFYVALEQSYGVAATISASNRIPAVKLTAKQQTEKVQRADKTGSRTFAGNPSGLRTQTSFGLKTYMANWANPSSSAAIRPAVSGVSGCDRRRNRREAPLRVRAVRRLWRSRRRMGWLRAPPLPAEERFGSSR